MSNVIRRNFLFDDFLTKDWFETQKSHSQREQVPSVNILEAKDSYEIELAAPGLTKEDFKIELKENNLLISAETSTNVDSDDKQEKKYSRREFTFTSFKRNFTLPKGTMKEDLTAEYTNGILKVEIKKVKEKEPESTQITIN